VAGVGCSGAAATGAGVGVSTGEVKGVAPEDSGVGGCAGVGVSGVRVGIGSWVGMADWVGVGVQVGVAVGAPGTVAVAVGVRVGVAVTGTGFTVMVRRRSWSPLAAAAIRR
jgi:hypothetical protein